MRPIRLQFIAADSGDEHDVLACSQCGRDVDMLAKIPVLGLNDRRKPWIGLCKDCVRRLLDGFAKAREK